ncbi:NAD(P)/FAD-dependent oxidoreductase [Gordonia westfalica]|uniref:Dehydrogenase (Flavoprotein) n=1 Tax=Gordonia westfalica TaxID=158898 RepID=A0A1H2J8H9_9ACTN|nr:NAD(P)/FAD-dependent oxidoreductase [Gordonia westfalica]SDU52476.1 Dehydrogenase (flavoprotein) [Gordonia westfalica]
MSSPAEVNTTEEFDAIIVGARCAGSATAIALAGRGFHVLVIDSARFPSDTLSTHLLWPSTLAEIHALGALPAVEEAGAPRLPIAEAILDEISWRTGYSPVAGIDYGMCLRRTHLDAALVRTAASLGANIRQQCRATGLIWTENRVVGLTYTDSDDREHTATAPIVIGADGRKSIVAREVGAETLISSRSGRSCYFAYWTDPREDLRHIASQWRVDGLLGTAFPCDDGQTLCLLQPPVELDAEFHGRKVTDAYRAGVAALPGLARRLDGAEMVSRVRSCTGIASYFRRSSGPGWALPGDAGHFKDPVTAQGIRDAYRYGRLLGEMLAPILVDRGGPDPHAIDAATAEWAAQRERDCVEIYQWTNVLAAGRPPSPLEYEIYHRAQDIRNTPRPSATSTTASRRRRRCCR